MAASENLFRHPAVSLDGTDPNVEVPIEEAMEDQTQFLKRPFELAIRNEKELLKGRVFSRCRSSKDTSI